MRYISVLFFIVVFSLSGNAQSKDEEAILSQLEKLKQAMLSDNEKALESLTSPMLSYGHSNGLIEDKKAFIKAIMDNTANFTSIDLSQVDVTISGPVAYVRHHLHAETHNGQQPGKVALGVFLVWQKNNNGTWLLLGRQAFKL